MDQAQGGIKVENLYPLFERNRILKKELMWALRDYAFANIQLEYQDFSDGIIKGCDIKVREKELAVSRGIVKYGGFVYLITEEMTVTYAPEEQLKILKMKMETDKKSEDFIAYRVTLFLDDNPVKGKGELEVCRFKLQHGSGLRNDYKDFEDMSTEFDTVNVIEADWSSISGKTLSPKVTGYFAEQVLAAEFSQAEDINFAYLCLNHPGAVNRRVIENYVERRLADSRAACGGNPDIFHRMVLILHEIRTGSSMNTGQGMRRRQIVVD